MPRALVLALAAAVLAGCGGASDANVALPTPPRTMKLMSSAFADGAAIPARFTCNGEGHPPPLRWSRVPSRTRELVLFVEDRDAPGGVFVHWVLPGLAPDSESLPAGAEGYKPPCPPTGDKAHAYRFELYALAKPSGLTTAADGATARKAIKAGKPLALGLLVGRFAR